MSCVANTPERSRVREESRQRCYHAKELLRQGDSTPRRVTPGPMVIFLKKWKFLAFFFFFLKKCQVFGVFLTAKWQFSGGSGSDTQLRDSRLIIIQQFQTRLSISLNIQWGFLFNFTCLNLCPDNLFPSLLLYVAVCRVLLLSVVIFRAFYCW